MEQFRQKGNLLSGVEMEGGGTLRVEKNFVDVSLPEDLAAEVPDNRILKVCLGLSRDRSEHVILHQRYPSSNKSPDPWNLCGGFHYRTGF